MKRRDFIKVSSAAGVTGVVGSGFNSFAAANGAQTEGFDLHPFIKAHPEAVFINLTSVKEFTDSKAIYDASFKLANEMFVKTQRGQGHPISTKITAKPNWTSSRPVENDPTRHLGVTTDLNFIEGFLCGVKTKGPQSFSLRDCASPGGIYRNPWDELGFFAMCEKNNFDLQDFAAKEVWEYENGEIVYKEVKNGVIFKEVGYLYPMNAPNTFLINMSKFKSHSMGITACVKNLQGIAARRLHQFCNPANPFNTLDERLHRFFQPDCMERIAALHKQHVEAGIPRWDSMLASAQYTGLNMERWTQRMLDSFSVTPTGIHIVEGVYGLDGNGFTAGPWEGDRGRNFMSNNIIFGLDAFRVDIITHWLAGHEPGNFGLFHIGIERGFSNVLDPADIPVYVWENGAARKVELNTLKRTPLVTPYLRKEGEDRYHMCNEPFNYSAWKRTGKIAAIEPSIRAIGTDSNNHIVMDMTVPQKGDVYVEIMNSQGELLHRLYADGLEPGVHQVVWDGFAAPGLYTTYVKGMSWDAENEIVIYS